MLGCASLPGTDPGALAPVLSFLHHNVLAPEGLRPRALADRFIRTDRMPAEAVDTAPGSSSCRRCSRPTCAWAA